jgi:hypothetical protein
MNKRKLEKQKKENFLKRKKLNEKDIYGTLPDEILINIFSFIIPILKVKNFSKKDLQCFFSLNLVAKQWYNLFNSSENITKFFWLKIYKSFFNLEENLFKDIINDMKSTDIKLILLFY